MLNNRAYLEDAAEQTFVYLEGPHYPCGRNITELLLNKTGVDCLCATLVDVVEKWDAEVSGCRLLAFFDAKAPPFSARSKAKRCKCLSRPMT
jgi:hypothetical protein